MSDYETEVKNARIRSEDAKDYLHELLKSCPHTETVEEYTYTPGTYYDTSSTIYDTRCKLCRKILETTKHQGKHYG